MQTVDIQYKRPDGWSLFGAVMGRYTSDGPVSATAPAAQFDSYDWGLIAQAAYAVDQHWEPFVRFEYIRFDEDSLAEGSDGDVPILTIGTTYYIYGQSAKFTIDGMFLPNGTPVSDDGAGILANDGEPEFILRCQFQLLL